MRRALAALLHSSRHAAPRQQPGGHYMRRPMATLPGSPRSRKRPSNPSQRQLRATPPSNPNAPPPLLRVRDPRINALLSKTTLPADFARRCQELRRVDAVELLASVEPHAWNVALQNRFQRRDANGAVELLELLLSFDAENTSPALWSDLLFTVLRQPSRLANDADLRGLLNAVKFKCGDDAVADTVVSLVNGCAKLAMFDEAQFLVRYHATLRTSTPLPPPVLGVLMTQMQAKRRHDDVCSLADALVKGELAMALDSVQPQVWMAIFRSATDVTKYMEHFLAWFDAVKHHCHVQLERVLGAAVQTCVAQGHGRTALQCFDAFTREDSESESKKGDLRSSSSSVPGVHAPRRVHPDENIYVNALKACMLDSDHAAFRDVYARMVRDGVARSAGFGSAIRFCRLRRDVAMLEDVLRDAFAAESDAWWLPLPQYNDALSCFVAAKEDARAMELFARLLDHATLLPDEYTMVAMGPLLRVRDLRFVPLLSKSTSPADFARRCQELRRVDVIEPLASVGSHAWNVALQNRLGCHDADGAKALLELLLSFDAENTSPALWSDLLFTVLRQPSRLANDADLRGLLNAVKFKCGDDAVADTVVSLVNGCAKLAMFDEAQFLVRYHATLRTSTPLPPPVLGVLMTQMQAKRRHDDVCSLADALVKGELAMALDSVQPQVWMAIFRSATDVTKYMEHFLAWFDAVKHHCHVQLERVLGAAVQTCVAQGHGRTALQCFDAFTREDSESESKKGDLRSSSSSVPGVHAPRRVHPDENIYVNALKACMLDSDHAAFRDVYARMVRDGVARSAGFGSAIRFCRLRRDVAMLEDVLRDAFAAESDAWWLPLPQYNDALSCFVAAKEDARAMELFARLLDHATLLPDEYTMVAMVDAHRAAPVEELFELMDVFLRCGLRPNTQVFTSLLAACARQRRLSDATALFDAMKQEGCMRDIKTYTTVGFVYAAHAHTSGLVALLRDMAADGVADDDQFHEYLLHALYEGHGIDMCFALVRELHVAGLAVPERMYRSLVALGTEVGLVERTLHMAYNMECEGFMVAEDELLELTRRCAAEAEALELVRTVSLLHQGRRSDGEPPRFSHELYDELAALTAKHTLRSATNEVQRLAEIAGYAGAGDGATSGAVV